MPRGGRLLWKYTWQMNSPYGQLSKKASRLQVAGVKAIFINSTNSYSFISAILRFCFTSPSFLFFSFFFILGNLAGSLQMMIIIKICPKKTLSNLSYSKNRTTPGRRKTLNIHSLFLNL